MKKIILKGNYKKIGFQLGQIYRRNGKSFADVKINKDLYAKQLVYYKKYYPELLEELRGIADGGNYDGDKVIYDNLIGEINWYKNKIKKTSCTVFGVKNNFGTFVGRNYDWYPEAKAAMYKYDNPESYSYVAITDSGYFPGAKKENVFYYPDDAINEKGLYIGITFADGPDTSFGLSSSHIRKLIIEKCQSVAEALAMFKKIPVSCPKNFFIADKTGEMAVAEHASGKNYKIIKPENGILIKANHYLDPALVKIDMMLRTHPTTSTFVRYYELLRDINLINPEKIKQDDITKLILNKNSYIRQNSFKDKTIWSLSLDMKKGRYYLYYRGNKREIVI
jgi:predicted choloylglycine hydrolase